MRFPELAPEELEAEAPGGLQACLASLRHSITRNKQAALAVQALVELCVEKGLLDEDELYQRMNDNG